MSNCGHDVRIVRLWEAVLFKPEKATDMLEKENKEGFLVVITRL